MTTPDVYEQMTEPSETRLDKAGHTRRSGILFCPKPAANSLSIALRAMRLCDPALHTETDFVESAVEEGEWIPAPAAPVTPESHALAQARSALASLYLEYESIAESLGPETPNIYARFCAVTDSEGLARLHLSDYR